MDKPILHIPFFQDIIAVAAHQGRPMALIEPLCKSLGLDPAAQVRRCEQQAESANLAVAVIWVGANPWHGIPLEDMSWFLRTLRPRDPKIQKKLELYRQRAAWVAMEQWVIQTSRYTERKAAQKLLRNPAGPREEPYQPKPPRAKGNGLSSRVYQEDVEQMRKLRSEGRSLGFISQEMKLSKATVSLCLSGKYLANPAPKPPQTPLAD
jgi:hypothetical protein